MSTWHNNFDSVYGRKARPIAQAIEQYVVDQRGSDPGSQIIEDLRRDVETLTKVVGAIASVLTSQQECRVAALLNLKPGSNAE